MTKEIDSALDGADLGKGYDDVDIFGLDEFGDPSGLPAIYGAMVGTGIGTLATLGVQSFWAEKAAYDELIGLAAGLAAGGVMAAMPKTRHAGWVAMASAVLNNGLRAAAKQFKAMQEQPAANGIGMHMIQPLNGHGSLGMLQAEALNGPGGVELLGPQTSQLAKSYGANYLYR